MALVTSRSILSRTIAARSCNLFKCIFFLNIVIKVEPMKYIEIRIETKLMSPASRAVSDYSMLSFEEIKEGKESKEVFPSSPTKVESRS